MSRQMSHTGRRRRQSSGAAWSISRPSALIICLVAACLALAAGSRLVAQRPVVNNPPVLPHSILVFPQRDFVSSSGFSQTDSVVVSVIHQNGTTIGSVAAVPQDDPATPGFDGIVEVNHPGGVCWVGVTPDIRGGDRVRTTATDSITGAVAIDETTVQDVIAKRPVIIKHESFAGALDGILAVHGTARAQTGGPIPVTQLEQRLIANRDAFDINGRRTLRAPGGVVPPAPGDGVMDYDPVSLTNPAGVNWTATYAGLDENDVVRGANAESRGMWLGAGAAGAEGTIYEIGAGIFGGPAAPCVAPLEVLPPPPGSELIPPSTPADLSGSTNGINSVYLTWSASTDNVGVTSYGVYRNGVAIANVSNGDGSAPAPTAYADLNVAPGTYIYTVDAADEIGNRSGQSNSVSETTTLQAASALLACGATGFVEPCFSDPPAAFPEQVQLITFPARDFTSSSGYLPNDQVVIELIRNGFVISTATAIPIDDPTTVGFDGTVEVNHPGGVCWEGVTPDLRSGDILRQTAYAPVANPDGTTSLAIRRVDQTVSANISVQRPVIVQFATGGSSNGVIEVHGTAMDRNGNPIPLANIVQRMVAGRDAFDLNGRRTLRAGAAGNDGVFVYDGVNNPTGAKFTATYSGLDENDVFRAAGGTTSTGRTFEGAESRVLWLDDPTVVAPAITIYENSDLTISGPAAAFCFSPNEPLDTAPPSTPSLTVTHAGPSSNQLNWTASSDDFYVYGYGVYRDGVRIRNLGNGTSFVDQNVPAGDHTYAVDAVDSASPLKVNYPGVFAGPNTSDPILQGVEWGNRSSLSNAITVTQPDVLAPSVPQNVVASATGNNITLAWSASTDNVGVAGYRVYRNDGATFDVATNGVSNVVPMPAPNTQATYTYTVDAVDAAANRSAQSAAATVIVAGIVDVTAPTTPTNLVADTRDLYAGAVAPALGPRDVKLTWTASTDNIGVTSYGIYRRTAAAFDSTSVFVKIADVGAGVVTFTDVGVAVGSYDYRVDAVDSAANRSAASDVRTAVTVSDPPLAPHAIIPFPQRDFVSSTGYLVSEGPVVVSAIRHGVEISHSTPIVPVEDPATPGLGAVEVNHPGGGCWVSVTPDLVAGDIIRFTNASGLADQTTIANVTTGRAISTTLTGAPLPAGQIQTHGTAQDTLGNPLSLFATESRLVASSATPFDVNGRRVLRAGGAGNDGTLAFDPIDSLTNPRGINWTATFNGLTAADVQLAIAAEARGVWLGRDPAALTELTIYENGDGVVGGPAGGTCTAPAPPAPAVTLSAASLSFGNVAVGATSAAQTVTLTNSGTADLIISSVGIAGSADFTLSANTCTATPLAPNASCSTSVTFRPSAIAGRTATFTYTDNAANSPTQGVALIGTGSDATAPVVTTPVQTFVIPSNLTVAGLTGSSAQIQVSWSGSDSSGIASFELQKSTNNGTSWTNVPLTDPTATSITLTNPVGGLTTVPTLKWRVRATDRAIPANTSAYVTASNYRMYSVDDVFLSGLLTVTYQGGWSTGPVSGALGGSVHFASAATPRASLNKISFTVNGSDVAWISTIGPNRGQASIAIDGVVTQIVDLYSPTQQPAKLVASLSGIGAGTHTVTVTVLGTKAAASTGTRVDVDGFVLKF